jgi:hypothetical protein
MYLQESIPATENRTGLKVKMFIHNTLAEVEDAVNGWLAAQNITISHIAQSQSEKQGKFYFVLSVFYKPDSTEKQF